MKTVGRELACALDDGQQTRRIPRRDARRTVDVADEVAVHVEHRLHLVAALAHARDAGRPAEAREADAALDAEAGLLELRHALDHRQPRAHRVVEENHRLVGVVAALEELARAVRLALLAHDDPAVLPAGEQDARLQERDRGQAVRRDLPRLELLEELEETAARELGAARREAHALRVEHPAADGLAVAREDRIFGGSVKDPVAQEQPSQLLPIAGHAG